VTIGRIRTPIFHRGRTFSRNHMIDPDHIVLSLTARVGHARESSPIPAWLHRPGRSSLGGLLPHRDRRLNPLAVVRSAPLPPETTHARNANRWGPPT
jgi:hypothetical protein